jgi:hypothetical protein
MRVMRNAGGILKHPAQCCTKDRGETLYSKEGPWFEGLSYSSAFNWTEPEA